jgi:hypothetical protein
MTARPAGELKKIEADLTDHELIWMVGRRMKNTPGFDLAVTALECAAEAGWDRGHKVGAQRGVEYEYKRLVDYYTAAGAHNGLTEVEQKALEEFQATPAASTAEGWEKFLRGLGVPLA